MSSEAIAAAGAVGTLLLGASIAWTGDYFRDRRAMQERMLVAQREDRARLDQRRWDASLAVLNQANALYAKARDLATLRHESRRGSLIAEIETARSQVTTSLSAAFLMAPEPEVRDAFARVIRCCRDLGDEALGDPAPTLDSLSERLSDQRAAVKHAESLLRVVLGVQVS